MARTWINTNNNQGNVLRCFAVEIAAASGTITPKANINVIRMLDATGAITLTVDGAKSLPGDRMTVIVQATGETTITIAGDAAPGSVVINAGGVGALEFINGGSNGATYFVGPALLS